MSRQASGVAMLIASMACFAASDALAKKLTTRLPVLEVTWFRYIALMLTVLPLLRRDRRVLRSGHLAWQIGRALGMIGSAILFILALGRLPIADATAMVFASPLFVTVLSALLLRERVAALRWAILMLGFAGVLVVMRPGSSAFQAAALLPLGSSIAWAIAIICTRKVSETDGVAVTMTHSALIGCVLLTVMAIPVFVAPTAFELLLVLAMATAWCGAQWLTVQAYHRAEASTLAPFAYSQLLFATVIGVTAFGQWPDAFAFAGIGLILCCGAAAGWESARRLGARAAEEEAVR